MLSRLQPTSPSPPPPHPQVEGLVADRNLSLKHLIGMIKTFFEAIGITQLCFKPAFNPYTEVSYT